MDRVADYHSDHSAVSASMLKVFMESRREYEARYVTHTLDSPEPSDSMRLGSLAHAMLLEPEKVDDFVAIPRDVLAANGAKMGAKWKAFEEENAGKTLLKPDEFNAAWAMIDAVRSKCGEWFNGHGRPEHELRWTDKETGLPCKAKLDYLIPGLILDFKTSKSSSPRQFRQSIRNYRYDVQEAHYTSGVETITGKPARFLFVVVKSEPLHLCRVYETPEFEHVPEWKRIDKSWGRICREQAMKDLAECYETGDFSDPGESEVVTLYEDEI